MLTPDYGLRLIPGFPATLRFWLLPLRCRPYHTLVALLHHTVDSHAVHHIQLRFPFILPVAGLRSTHPLTLAFVTPHHTVQHCLFGYPPLHLTCTFVVVGRIPTVTYRMLYLPLVALFPLIKTDSPPRYNVAQRYAD